MKILSDNRKARFNYEIIDSYTCGLVLEGCEIKSLRAGNMNMSESFCVIDKGEVWMKNMYIKEYENRGYVKVDSLRDRKLLLRKHEIRKLTEKLKTKGMTLIPIKLLVNDYGLIKVELGLCKGKKTYDKRNDIKEKDIKRDIERSLR